MSEDTISDAPSAPEPQPIDPRPALTGEVEGGSDDGGRGRLRQRGGRGRRGGPESPEAGRDEPAGAPPDPAAQGKPESTTPPEREGGDTAPDGTADPRPQGNRPARDPRDPRRDGRPPRPDQRPPRPEPRDQRRDFRPPRPEPRPPRPERPERPDRTVIDPNEVADMAWQLFFGELREEGLALVDDSDAEKLTNRCFKIAEIFLRTRQRRMNQLFGGGTMIVDERPRDEGRTPPPPRPKPEVPIDQRLPDDPSRLSKLETEALIDEAQEAAAATAETSTEQAPVAGPPAEPPSPDDGGD